VQIIKKDPVHGGILQFGSEPVIAADHSIVAMLGASPGASTAVWIMLQVIERCFGEKLKAAGRSAKLKELVPSIHRASRGGPAGGGSHRLRPQVAFDQ
jgi:malate dehydrogenase (quinone)